MLYWIVSLLETAARMMCPFIHTHTYKCIVFFLAFPFFPSREVVQSLVDEYRACESPDYANYGDSHENTQVGGKLEVPAATAEAVHSAT